MTFGLGFKARVDFPACVLHHLHAMDSSDSAQNTTSADLLVASMAAELFELVFCCKT